MSDNNAAFVGAIPENYDRYLGLVLFEPYKLVGNFQTEGFTDKWEAKKK